MLNLLSCSWTDIDALDPARRILLMVLGPTEQHGPHLPLGTDIFAANEMSRRMAEIMEDECGQIVVEAPPLYFTPAVLSREFPGSVSIRKHHYRAFLSDVLTSYADNGLHQAVLVSSHIDPPFVLATQRVCQEINQKYGTRYISGYERFPLEDITYNRTQAVFGYEKPGDVHAGLMETSNTLLIRPDLVKTQLLPHLEPQPMTFEVMAQLRSLKNFALGQGYTGYPAEAQAHFGTLWFARYGEMFGNILRDYCRGEDVFERLSIEHLLPSSP